MKPRFNPDKRPCSIAGLVVAGLFFTLIGLFLIFHPVAYVSFTNYSVRGEAQQTWASGGCSSSIVGGYVVFLGGFILAVAYRIKYPKD